MTMRQKKRAKKCLNHNLYGKVSTCGIGISIIKGLTGVTLCVSPSSTHNCTSVRLPTQAIVNRPTHLTLTVAPRLTPVAPSQIHQDGVKALDGPCSCWFMNETQESAVQAVNRTRGESRRIRRDWVRRAFSMPLVSTKRSQFVRREKPTEDNDSSAQ